MFEWLEARGGRWSQLSWPLASGRKLPDTDHGCLAGMHAHLCVCVCVCLWQERGRRRRRKNKKAPACDILDYWIQTDCSDNWALDDIEPVSLPNMLLFAEIYQLPCRDDETKTRWVLCACALVYLYLPVKHTRWYSESPLIVFCPFKDWSSNCPAKKSMLFLSCYFSLRFLNKANVNIFPSAYKHW